MQIIGRMIRVGSQEDACYAIHLVCSDTIDDIVQETVRSKMDIIEKVLGERVKGTQEQDVIFKADSETRVIFDALVTSARSRKLAAAKCGT